MCGIIGMLEGSPSIYYGMLALQHRGQQSAGIANANFASHASSVEELMTKSVPSGKCPMVGHTRYATAGGFTEYDKQPFLFSSDAGEFALVHNGNLVNTDELRREIFPLAPKGSTDSELIGLLIQRRVSLGFPLYGAIGYAVRRCRGAASVIVISGNRMYAYRDRQGVRPLVFGGNVVASETCALDALGVTPKGTIEPDTMYVFTAGSSGPVVFPYGSAKRSRCIFEDIYFSRPDSILETGVSVYEYRVGLGKKLARRVPAEADIVIGTPDSGIAGALGYAAESGIPYGEGLVKNKYIGRTFIQPNQEMRKAGVKVKLNAIPNVLRGLRVVLVDDSIVRGNTCKRTIALLRSAGAAEVHMRLTSPKIIAPCYYGMDFATSDELIANRCSDTAELADFIGADSLGYLEVSDLADDTTELCMACFDKKYPIPLDGHDKVCHNINMKGTKPSLEV